MRWLALLTTVLLACLLCGAAPGADPPLVEPGRWSEAELAGLLATAHRLPTPGAQIVALSEPFLGTPYVAGTLLGGPQTPERLVINLAGVDCFTFLDVIEALRRADGPADLPDRLRQVRYRDGVVAYDQRRHFFSDWVVGADAGIRDVTVEVGQGRAVAADKQLNRKRDGSRWLPGIPVVRRAIHFIPAARVDGEVLAALQAGDYVGIYSEQAGLDVSHVGLLVPAEGRVMLRHASSAGSAMRVVDVELRDYLRGKPGLVVYRARRGAPGSAGG